MSPRIRIQDQSGIAIIAVLGFLMVFLALSVALFWLMASGRSAAELERKEVKAFNVAEAGIDAGMLALKLQWPEESSVAINEESVRNALRTENPALYLPSRSDNPEADFLDVRIYDNSVQTGETYETVYVPRPDEAPTWDANGDGRMYVDSRANVDDDRHRIIVLAERQAWPLDFPRGRALWATQAGANGQGLKVYIDPLSPDQEATAYYESEFGKGVERGPGVSRDMQAATFDNVVTQQTWEALKNIAYARGTYFTTAAAATSFLSSGQAGGNVVFVKANSAVTIPGTTQIGSRDNPLILVLDTPEGSDNVIDLRGTSDFYGIILVRGNALMRGTCSIWGQALCSGTMEGRGAGSTPEINYNSYVIDRLNRDFVISVNIVPNTWEEYTVP